MKIKNKPIYTKGLVVKGSGDGSKIGFPTINLDVKPKVDLEYGVYACRIFFKSEFYNAILHYGPRLIFNEEIPKFEVHIFNFKQKIYGEEVVVEIFDFIRPTSHFANLEKLIERITIDCEEAQKILKKYNLPEEVTMIE